MDRVRLSGRIWAAIFGCGKSAVSGFPAGFGPIWAVAGARFQAFRSDLGFDFGCGRSTASGVPVGFGPRLGLWQEHGFRLSGRIWAAIWAVAGARFQAFRSDLGRDLGCGRSTQNPDSGDFRSLPADFPLASRQFPLDRFSAFRSDLGRDLGCGRSTQNPDSGDFRSLPADFRSLPANFRSIGFRLSGRIWVAIWAVAGAHRTRIPVISALFPPISARFPPISARSVFCFPVGFGPRFGLWQEHGFRRSGRIWAVIWAVAGARFQAFRSDLGPRFGLWQEHGFRRSGRIWVAIWDVAGAHRTRIPLISLLFPSDWGRDLGCGRSTQESCDFGYGFRSDFGHAPMKPLYYGTG